VGETAASSALVPRRWYNESEQITGWFTVIDENLAVPFELRCLEFRLPSNAST
jgi:hypothetical protein